MITRAEKKGYAYKPDWFALGPFTETSLYEIIHICTAVVDETEEWSSQ